MRGYGVVLLPVVVMAAVLGGFLLGLAPPSSPAAQQQSGMVGSEVCAACHGDLFEQFRATPHVKLLGDAQVAPERMGCEACHGPGEAHVAAGGGKGVGGLFTFREESPRARADTCLVCHRKEVERFQSRRSEHQLIGVACTDCHAVHQPQTPQGLLKQKTPELCLSCHQEIRREFALPVRHRVLEGVLSCTECHSPHGSLSRFSLRDVNSETCTRCHTEKRGPFAFEHLSNPVEGCTICHTPHGSTNKFLLKRREGRTVCLECHSNAPLFHNQARGAFFRGDCTRCHTQIHGSNFNRFFFQ